MIGTTLLHYRIVDRLGEGSMGEVHLAEESEHFKSLLSLEETS